LNLGLYTRLKEGKTCLLTIQKYSFTMLLEGALSKGHCQMRINEISIPRTTTAHTVGIFNGLEHIPLYAV
jgi:hypothetical protein